MLKIKYHVFKHLMPNEKTIKQLEQAAKEKDAFSHIAVMPDVHDKKGRKCPTGTVVATRKYIMPQVLDTAPNCGMRLIRTPWGEGSLSDKQIDTMFNELVKTVPTRTYLGNYVNFKTILDICRYGSKGLIDYLKGDESEVENTMRKGNFFNEPPGKKDLLNAVPRIFFRIAQFRLGILGEAGNHFLDLMKIDEIIDEEKAKILKLKKGQYVFLLHTGSGVFGQYNSYFFTPKKEEHLSMKIITNLGRLSFFSNIMSRSDITKLQKEVKKYRDKKEFFKIDPSSARGKAYQLAHFSGANYGFANRTMIVHNLNNSLKKVFKKRINLKTVYDIPHVFVDREKHFGQNVWVHRNGASRGFGPKRMSGHPQFEKTGEPGFLAGSMSTPSYLVCGLDSNSSTFYSINHGAGRSKKADELAPQTKEELFEKMQKNKVKLYNAKSKGVVQQASGYYKDIDEILKVNQEFKMSAPVAKLTPVAVLMA
ncbi:MAG: hypothetical protein GF347_02320 [Candidatus Moranbacteria bacterium]|nr:hypothetical protein [Candidatus Moranbacteria bacterium]